MRIYFTLIGFLCFVCLRGVPQKTTENIDWAKKPNIILIMADDLGYETIGAYGNTSYQTPELDRLAKQGIRFTRCYSNPLCTPSRVKIMTGKYNFRNYVGFARYPQGESSFGNILKNGGYATCVVGKWQLGSLEGSTGPNALGFDQYRIWDQRKDYKKRYNDPILTTNNKKDVIHKGEYGPELFTEFMLDFIEQNWDVPFFVYFPMCLTHSLFEPTPLTKNHDQSDHENFADMVNYMDKMIGRIRGKLENLGLDDQTLIIFTGDNGTHRSIISEMSRELIRGGKEYPDKAGTHVPLIAYWKGVIPERQVCNDLVDFTDFFPTLTHAAGIEAPDSVSTDGRSFFPQMLGEKGNPRDWIFMHYIRSGEVLRFAQDKRYKLYEKLKDANKFEKETGMLFDIKNDPLEQNPIMPGEGNRNEKAARKKLQSVLNNIEEHREPYPEPMIIDL